MPEGDWPSGPGPSGEPVEASGGSTRNGLCCGSSYFDTTYFVYASGRRVIAPSTENIVSAIKWAGLAGFDAIELEVLNPQHMNRAFGTEQISHIRSAAEQWGVRTEQILFTTVFTSFPWTHNQSRLKSLFSRCVEISVALDARTIEIESGPMPSTNKYRDKGNPRIYAHSTTQFRRPGPWRDTWEEYTRSLGEICDTAKTRGLNVAVEARPREFIANTDAMMMLLEDTAASNLGVLFDVGWQFAMRETLEASIWKLGKRIIAVHVADNDGMIDHHWAPGEGVIDWKSVMKAFKSEGYLGNYTIDSATSGPGGRDFVRAKAFISKIINGLEAPAPVRSQLRVARS